MEQNTIDLINSLNLSDDTKYKLFRTLEWEKELSWTEGYEAQTEIDIEPQSAEEFLEDKVGMYNQFQPVSPRVEYSDIVNWLKEYKHSV